MEADVHADQFVHPGALADQVQRGANPGAQLGRVRGRGEERAHVVEPFGRDVAADARRADGDGGARADGQRFSDQFVPPEG